MILHPLETLCELVAIPSVNPMGRHLSGPEFLERRLTDHLQRTFDALGLAWVRQTVEPGRDNIIAFLAGAVAPDDGGRVLLWEAHQDTVPVDGMSIPPFLPQVREGRVYGRGACDIKGGMAAMLAALSRLLAIPSSERPNLLMACTVNEEHGYSGATRLARLWGPGGENPWFRRKADVAVVAEPTSLDVVVAHKGAVRWRAHTTGRSTHSSQPQLGVNAIYKMGRVVLALERYHREITPTLGQHPLCGKVTLSVGTISGGISVNTVPERATIEIDRRLLPGERADDAYQHVRRFLAHDAGLEFTVEHDPPFLVGMALADTDNRQLAERLSAAATEVTGRAALVGVPYGTDAAAISAAGIPAVVFGPGSIDQAHTADEWLALEPLDQAAEILYRFARAF